MNSIISQMMYANATMWHERGFQGISILPPQNEADYQVTRMQASVCWIGISPSTEDCMEPLLFR